MISEDSFSNIFLAKKAVDICEVLTGMQPAYRHSRTGESHLAQERKGVTADVYSFEGLPEDWIVEWDDDGNATALHPDIVPGYWRDARFIELSQLQHMPLDS